MKNIEYKMIPFMERLLNGATVEWKPLGEVAQTVQRIDALRADIDHIIKELSM